MLVRLMKNAMVVMKLLDLEEIHNTNKSLMSDLDYVRIGGEG